MAGASSVLAGMLLTGIEPTGEEIGKSGNGVTYKVSSLCCHGMELSVR